MKRSYQDLIIYLQYSYYLLSWLLWKQECHRSVNRRSIEVEEWDTKCGKKGGEPKVQPGEVELKNRLVRFLIINNCKYMMYIDNI